MMLSARESCGDAACKQAAVHCTQISVGFSLSSNERSF